MSTEKLPHARKELRAAGRALQAMRDSKGFEEFEDAWRTFLGALEKAWTKLELAGKGVGSKFEPWLGTQAAARRKDPLLRYLKHARNADQHTLAEVVTFTPPQVNFSLPGGPGVVHVKRLEIKNGQIFYEGSHPPTVTRIPPRLDLQPVKDRGDWYNPPTQHLGIALKRRDPLAVAELGLAYYSAIVGEAEGKFF